MALKRYTASADTTIVNAFEPNLRTRGTGANMGAADVLETFSIYGRQSTSSAELSRILVKFPVASVSTDRTNAVIPGSGSVNFYLRMFNAANSKTAPSGAFSYTIEPLSRDWQEGYGLDLEGYKDVTKGNIGANWMSSSDSTAWSKTGGDYISTANAAYPYRWYNVDATTGINDLEVDVTQLVELWIAGTLDNYGVGVHLSGAYEAYYNSADEGTYDGYNNNLTGATVSYYTKRFFARGSQFFFKRPTLEARWDSTRKDDRGDFYYSSSLAGVNENLNTIYLYNYIRGQLTDIPGSSTGAIYVSLYSGSADNGEPSGSALALPTTLPRTTVEAENPYVVTGGWISTGIYTASFAVTSSAAPLTKLFDVWHDGIGTGTPGSTNASTEYVTGSIVPLHFSSSQTVQKSNYYMNITNLEERYSPTETARFNLYVRHKNWSPTIYTKANSSIENLSILSASYRVFRVLDGYNAVSYGTGSDKHTEMSYDISGNYFDFDMRLLEPGYTYAFKFAFYENGINSWLEQPPMFKFRVEDHEY